MSAAFTLTVNNSTTFSGNLGGPAPVTVAGIGTLTLNGNNSGYTAGILDLDIGPLDVFASKPLTAGRIARAARDALDRGKRTGTR